jgi:hypothetical protein
MQKRHSVHHSHTALAEGGIAKAGDTNDQLVSFSIVTLVTFSLACF